MSKILLHTPEGVRDIYGKEYAEKLVVQGLIQDTVHRFGYEDIQTPGFEFFDVFSKEVGTTPSRELYKFFDKEGNTLVLRPDFTPSIARCAAKYFMDTTEPIRFCYVGNTYTNTSNLQGKLKEVTQMGAELIGDGSTMADAEMLATVVMCLKNAGLEEFQISVGNAEYFKGLCQNAGISRDDELKLREYISGKNVFGAEELLAELGISDDFVKPLLQVTDLFGDEDMLHKALQIATNNRSKAAVERLLEVYDALKCYGIQQYVSFDLGMLSKYNYYTGIIFRGYTYGVGDAIVTGGRYDHLLSQFGKTSPAIGFTILIDDLLVAMDRQKLQISVPDVPTVLTYTDADFAQKVKEATALREEGKKVVLTRA